MITPPVFAICAASPAVRAILGENPTRVFPFGQAPQTVAHPYAVWQVISGRPENYLADIPEVDFFTVQIDIYGREASSVRQAATAVRQAIEIHHDITGYGGESRDATTKNFRYSFDARFGTIR